MALKRLAIVAGLAHLCIVGPGGFAAERAPFLLCCKEDNDLYRVLRQSGIDCARYPTADAAVTAAAPGSAILILADEYPDRGTSVSQALLDAAADGGSRIFVEYPSSFPGLDIGKPRQAHWQRGVVSSGFFGEDLKPMAIVEMHGCRFLPLRGGNPHIVLARVAGYDTAVYGLPDERFPVLLQLADRDILLAATSLSRFVTARYRPVDAWADIWNRILTWLAPEARLPPLQWTPTVRPTYPAEVALPDAPEGEALRRVARWFRRSKLLIDESRLEDFARTAIGGQPPGPIDVLKLESGDGSHGMLEGYSAHIRPDGSQPRRHAVRNDCMGESAMALAFGGVVNDSARSRRVAHNLCDFICFDSLIQQGVRGDPSHPAFGLMAWGITSRAWERAFYGDDNARAMLGILATASLLGSDRWDESMLKALLANLRTTGRLGFRGSRINVEDLAKRGWRYYHDREIVNRAPHYEAYLWACYLLAYRATGHTPFFETAEAGISNTMEATPDQWRWTNGTTQELARMLLPLAWLVRLDDTPQHRAWLRTVAEQLLKFQVGCGALRETLGDPSTGAYGAVPSNEAYGTTETPIIQSNGDPACDMLYTTNFAFIGLHEAAQATGDAYLKQAEDRLARFLCRIQIRSEAHPELDGAWFRAFDFDRWEYWGSSGDAGWGAWSIESGWIQTWIAAALALRILETNLWDLLAAVQLEDDMPRVQRLMELNDGGPYAPAPEPVQHAAEGAQYELGTAPDERYPGTPGGLSDGRAWPAIAHQNWHGWEGRDLVATIDLGKVVHVRQAGAVFMRSCDLGIFLPIELRVAVSVDGESFNPAASEDMPPPVPGDRLCERRRLLIDIDRRARYIRLHATCQPAIPDWHHAADRPAWLFADELVVRASPQ